MSEVRPIIYTNPCIMHYIHDPPRKTLPHEVGNFGLRGSVCARLAGTVAVNVTQVMVSSKSFETGA